MDCTNISIKELFKKLGLNRKDVKASDSLITTALDVYANEQNITSEILMNTITRQQFVDIISSQSNKQIQNSDVLFKQYFPNVDLETSVVGNSKVFEDARRNKNTLYVFGENAQAYETITGNKVFDTIKVNNGLTLNTKTGSTAYRTDSNGDLNANAIGLVIKENAQDKDGNWLSKGGFFTESKRTAFIETNKAIIANIKKKLSEGNYNKLSIDGSLGMESTQGLPKILAEDLANLIKNELGLTVSVDRNVKNTSGEYYGLTIYSLPEEEKETKTKSKKSKSSKTVVLGEVLLDSEDSENISNNTYEVSSDGDKRFSALYARFKKGTIIDGVDVGGYTIEEVYQTLLKEGKLRHFANNENGGKKERGTIYKNSILNVSNYDPISNKEQAYVIENLLSKNPEFLNKIRNNFSGAEIVTLYKEDYENYSYYIGYLPLWQEWAKQNPELIEELREKSKGKTLTDKFATTKVNQARALSDILNQNLNTTFSTSKTNNYAERTKENADWSDVTLAFAIDFTTAGEKATKKLAGDKYVAVELKLDSTKDSDNISYNIEGLNSIISKYKDKAPIKLNIAGNGIYTLRSTTQENVNKAITDAINYLIQNGVNIEEIRSGGQTGVDEAGIIAAQTLGIPSSVHTTSNWKFRGKDGIDITDEEAFKARFNYKNVNNTIEKSSIFSSTITFRDKDNPYKKTDPQQNPTVAYVFTENAQAYIATHRYMSSITSDTILTSATPENTKLNVSDMASSKTPNTAGIRSIDGKTQQPNVFGLVVKKYQQLGGINSKFVAKEGQFKDTEEDFELFKTCNLDFFKSLDSFMKSNDNKVVFPTSIARGRAALPYRFAEWLQKELKDRFAVTYSIKQTETPGYEGYGLVITEMAESITYKKVSSNTPETVFTIDDIIQFKESVNPDKLGLLNRIYPSISKRKARIDYITRNFMSYLDKIIQMTKEDLDDIANINIDGLTDSQYEMYIKLNSGTTEQQRTYALNNFNIEGKPLGIYIIYSIYNDMKTLVDAFNASDSNKEYFINNVLLNPNTYFGNEFNIELQQNGVYESSKRIKEALKRATYLYNAFKPIVENTDIFSALIVESSRQLEVLENIKLSKDFKYSEATVEDLDNIDEEGSVDNRSGLNLVKYKTLDPEKTLSTRLKSIFAHMYKYTYSTKEGNKYIFDDLGSRVRMNPSMVFHILYTNLSPILNRPEDFIPSLEKLSYDYPWIYQLLQEIKSNDDLRNETYRAFRKRFNPSAMITTSGKLKRLNKEAKTDAFIDDITKSYEAHIVFGKHSIYDDNGEINNSNISYLRNLLTLGKDTKSSIEDKWKNHPLYMVMTVLSSSGKARSLYNVDNILKSLRILRGEEEGLEDISLENLLNDLGVDTVHFNMEALLPYIDEDELESAFENKEESKSKLDVLEEYFTPEQINKIIKILESAITITKDNSKGQIAFTENSHLINTFLSTYAKIGNALTMTADGYSKSSFLFGGTMRQSYVAPDYISDLVNIISNTSSKEAIEYANQYIEENFGRFDWFKSKGKWNNIWLRDFMTPDENGNYSNREIFAYYNILGIMGNDKEHSIGKVSDKDFLLGIISGYLNQDNKTALYRASLFSDRDVLVMFKNKKYTGDNYENIIINNLLTVVKQELDRILFYRNPKNNTNIIENFNDKRNRSTIFNFFPEFNKDIETIIKDINKIAKEYELDSEGYKNEFNKYFYTKIQDVLKFRFKDFIECASSLGIYDELPKIIGAMNIEENNEEDSSEVNIEETEETTQESTNNTEYITSLLKEFFYNDFFAQTQIIQLLGVDLSLYKSFEDFVKRNQQSYASGERLYGREKNEKGEEVKIMETCAYLEDDNRPAKSLKELQNILEESNAISEYEKSIYRGALHQYRNIPATDGQSYRSLKSFRKIFKAMGGKWTDAMENAYNNIVKNKTINIEDFIALWNSIKPFIMTYEVREINGRKEKVLTQHKNSEYMMSALYTMLNVAINNSPELQALQEFMEKYDIDVIHFHSVVKVGYNNPFDIRYNKEKFLKEKDNIVIGEQNFSVNSYNEYLDKLTELVTKDLITNEQYKEGLFKFQHTKQTALESLENQLHTVNGVYSQTPNENMFHKFPIEDIMIMQPTDDHLTNAQSIFGSQSRNIIPADLPEDFKIEITIGKETKVLNREEAVQYYNELIVDNLIDSFDGVKDKFSNIEKIKEAMDAAMNGNPKYGEDVRAALELNESKTDFKMPFNSPNLSNKIYELILSVFKNNITRQKIDGGNVVLVSNYGLSKNLEIEYHDTKNKKGIKAIQAYMPASMKEIYEDYLEEVTENNTTYWTINFEKFKKAYPKEHEDFLKVIGYRIPTEDKYSIFPIKIMGFMPITAGSTIMLPEEIITMSGTDFDIDKLFLMIKSIRREIYDSKFLYDRFSKYINNVKPELTDALLSTIFNEDVSKLSLMTEQQIINYLYYLQSAYKGIIYKEFKTLYESNDTFKSFVDNGYAEKAKLESPRYNPLKANKSKEFNTSLRYIKNRKERISTRNNMIIDFIWGVLTSEQVSPLLLQPGTYATLKNASRQYRNINNEGALKSFIEDNQENILKQGVYRTINKYSTEELESMYEKNASLESPIDVLTYVKKHRNLMDGNDLIGMSAVNSSSHYKYQFLNLYINERNQFNVTVKGNTYRIQQVDTVQSQIDGSRIGKICAELQAASPDNGKDPVLGDLNINPKTVSRIGFLFRVGLGIHETSVINNTDELYNYGKAMAQKYKDINLEKVLKEFNGSIEDIYNTFIKLKSNKDLNERDIQIAMQFALWRDNIDIVANALQSSTSISRCDSTNGALPVNLPDVIQYFLRADEFYSKAISPDFEIQGFKDMIDINIDANNMEYQTLKNTLMSSKIPRLQAFYTLGVKSAMTMASRYIKELNPEVIEAIKELRYQVARLLIYNKDKEILQTFFNQLPMYILSKNSIFTDSIQDGKILTIMDKRNYYIDKFPLKLKEYLEAKDENGNFLHPEVRNYSIIRRLSNPSKRGITFQNVGSKTTQDERQGYMEELNSLLYSSDINTVKLGLDLFMYSYYDNGLSFGHSNYGIFFSTIFLSAIPNYIENLRKYSNDILFNRVELEKYTRQFLLNNPKYIKTLVNTAALQTYKVRPNDSTIIDITKEGRELTEYVIGSTIRPIQFIKVRTEGKWKVFERIPDTSELPSYKEVSYNRLNKTNYTPYYDANLDATSIKWDELLNRGSLKKPKNKKQSTPKVTVKQSIESKESEIKVPKEESINVPEDVNESNLNIPQDNEVTEAMIAQGIPTDPDNNFEGDIVIPEDITIEEQIKVQGDLFTEIEERENNNLDKAVPTIEEFDDSIEDKLCTSN